MCADAGVGVSHCQYGAVAKEEVLVSGMPDGVAFKKPSAYGIRNCKAILAKKDGITFRSKFNTCSCYLH